MKTKTKQSTTPPDQLKRERTANPEDDSGRCLALRFSTRNPLGGQLALRYESVDSAQVEDVKNINTILHLGRSHSSFLHERGRRGVLTEWAQPGLQLHTPSRQRPPV